jgi:hypothetical protein
MDRFSVVAPTEKNVLTYKFANGLLSGETVSSATVVVTADLGIDPTPQNIINGALTVTASDVLVAFHNPIAGVDYTITVTAVTSEPKRVLTLAKILPCRNP